MSPVLIATRVNFVLCFLFLLPTRMAVACLIKNLVLERERRVKSLQSIKQVITFEVCKIYVLLVGERTCLVGDLYQCYSLVLLYGPKSWTAVSGLHCTWSPPSWRLPGRRSPPCPPPPPPPPSPPPPPPPPPPPVQPLLLPARSSPRSWARCPAAAASSSRCTPSRGPRLKKKKRKRKQKRMGIWENEGCIENYSV